MGEDFLRKKTERFIRCRQRDIDHLLETTLLSGIPAAESIEITGAACTSPLPTPGSFLWPNTEKDGSVTFFDGDQECVWISPARAQDIPGLTSGNGMIGQVIETDPELDSVTIRFVPNTEKDHDGEVPDP